MHIMKKTGLILGSLGAVAAFAIWKKNRKPSLNPLVIKGKVKEATGSIIGNDELKAEGKVDQFVGNSKDVLHDVAIQTSKIVDQVASSGVGDDFKGKTKEFMDRVTNTNDLKDKLQNKTN